VGRGGWTWYTGAASWFYRVAVRDILGIRTEAESDDRGNGSHEDDPSRGAGTTDGSPASSHRALVIEPCIPPDWPRYSAVYRLGGATYHISIVNPHSVSTGVSRATLDGVELALTGSGAARVPLTDDGAIHEITVVLD
jgi:cyclic beta-1,2-glucan synthetase